MFEKLPTDVSNSINNADTVVRHLLNEVRNYHDFSQILHGKLASFKSEFVPD
jgi:hypothetical protein